MHLRQELRDVGLLLHVRDDATATTERGTEEVSRRKKFAEQVAHDIAAVSVTREFLAGDDMPTGPVPPEPPCKKPTHGMHTMQRRMTAQQIAERAGRLVSGERNVTHGDARRNHANIGAFWSAYLQARFAGRHCITVTAHDVAWMMVLLKTARSLTGAHNVDDAVDCAGYAAIAGAIAEQDAAIGDAIERAKE
jgi:hypothetical protein